MYVYYISFVSKEGKSDLIINGENIYLHRPINPADIQRIRRRLAAESGLSDPNNLAIIAISPIGFKLPPGKEKKDEK